MITRFAKTFSDISIFSFIGILFNLVFVCVFLKLWINPQADDVELIFNLTIIAIFELFLVHSGVFIGIIGRSWIGWIGLILFYGIIAIVLNGMVKNNQILIFYGAVILNRMLPNILNKKKTYSEWEINMSGLYSLIYFVLFAVVLFCSEYIPKFGLTDEFPTILDYFNIYNAEVIEFSKKTHAIMCFGVMYYLMLTLMEVILIIRNIKRVKGNYAR